MKAMVRFFQHATEVISYYPPMLYPACLSGYRERLPRWRVWLRESGEKIGLWTFAVAIALLAMAVGWLWAS